MGKSKRSWTMKDDRDLIALSKTHTLHAIIDQMRRPPASIIKRASMLGLKIKRASAAAR